MSVDAPRFPAREHIGHKLNHSVAHIGRHWKSLTLTLAALGGLTYGAILMARPNVDDIQSKEPVKASDPYKAPETGVGQLVPVIITPEAVPTIAPGSPTPDTQGASGSSPDPSQDDQPEPKDDEPDPTKVVPDTQPTQTPLVETKAAIDCGLPSEICNKAEIIDWTNPAGQKSILIGWNKEDVPAGTPITMIEKGKYAVVKLPDNDPFGDVELSMFSEDGQWMFKFYGALTPKQGLPVNEGVIENADKGTIVNHTTDSKNTSIAGKKLVMTIYRKVDGRFIKDEEAMLKEFPDAKVGSSAKAPEDGSKGGTIHLNEFPS